LTRAGETQERETGGDISVSDGSGGGGGESTFHRATMESFAGEEDDVSSFRRNQLMKIDNHILSLQMEFEKNNIIIGEWEAEKAKQRHDDGAASRRRRRNRRGRRRQMTAAAANLRDAEDGAADGDNEESGFEDEGEDGRAAGSDQEGEEGRVRVVRVIVRESFPSTRP